jgi:hypothetical protein
VSKSLYGWVGDSLSNIPHLNYVSCFGIVESPSHVTTSVVFVPTIGAMEYGPQITCTTQPFSSSTC